MQAGLASYYVEAMDALYQICPGCLFLVEGTGQSKYGALANLGTCIPERCCFCSCILSPQCPRPGRCDVCGGCMWRMKG